MKSSRQKNSAVFFVLVYKVFCSYVVKKSFVATNYSIFVKFVCNDTENEILQIL